MGRSLNSQINNANTYFYGIMPFDNVVDFADKTRATNQHIFYMFARTQSMFNWDGLPDTIPARILELYLQMNGNACFAKAPDGELYVYTGGMGGEPDVYYRPTIYTVSNPAQKFSKNFKIGVDCVVMPNDALYIGLMPLFSRYATMISETELSINIASIMARVNAFISAGDDPTKESAEKFLCDLRDGKIGAIGENAFLDGIKVHPNAPNDGTIQSLIELLQYCRASWFNDIGLNANYNMKRESLNTTESQMNNDALLPLIDDMLNQRKTFAEKVNEMFGTNITVEFASSWKDNEIEIELEHGEIETPATEENETVVTEDVETVE